MKDEELRKSGKALIVGEEPITITLTQSEWTHMMRCLTSFVVGFNVSQEMVDKAWPAAGAIATALAESVGIDASQDHNGMMTFNKRATS